MSRTVTKPPDDPKMWRQVLALTHPDRGGSHDLFIWSRATMETICNGSVSDGPEPESPRRERPSTEEPDRVPFERGANFAELTRHAVAMADEVDAPYSRLLRLLYDCRLSPLHETQERRGASYKQLAAIGHRVEMTKRQRCEWYEIAKHVPLADRHARHLLDRLEGRSA